MKNYKCMQSFYQTLLHSNSSVQLFLLSFNPLSNRIYSKVKSLVFLFCVQKLSVFAHYLICFSFLRGTHDVCPLLSKADPEARAGSPEGLAMSRVDCGLMES